MNEKLTLVLVTVLALATGALGTALLRPEPAQAQAGRRWTECYLADIDEHADGGNAEQMRAAPGRIRLAPGWVPVGGVGYPNGRFVLLCR